MNTDITETKILLQQFIDEQYTEWLQTYSPTKLSTRALKKDRDKDETFYWTTGDEFIHEYILLSNGLEVSTNSITIEPGINSSDEFWKSSESWRNNNDDGTIIFIEVVVGCLGCESGRIQSNKPCNYCGDSAEWVFLSHDIRLNK